MQRELKIKKRNNEIIWLAFSATFFFFYKVFFFVLHLYSHLAVNKTKYAFCQKTKHANKDFVKVVGLLF